MSTSAVPKTTEPQAAPKRQLTLLDTTSIIVGIIIGSSIYESTPLIANMVPSDGWLQFSLSIPYLLDVSFSVPGAVWLAGFWLLGGLLSLVGALCYAELATAYPQAGGDYVYLTRAFGRRWGFLFAWAQLWVVRPGSIGAMAYVFARYANQLLPLGEGRLPLAAYATASIIVLTAVNILGVREGKWTQNILTIAKVLGLIAVVAAGLIWAIPTQAAQAAAAAPSGGDFRLALILILYAYGGWNEMAYVSAEVRNPEKNIVRALLLGTAAVAVIYIVVNMSFVHALGFEGVRGAKAVAAEVLDKTPLGRYGGWFISLLICVSALSAVNGLTLTGARIYYAMGTDHRLYRWLGEWSARWGTPARSLIIQAAVTLALVAGFELAASEQASSGFESMVKFTTPVFWFFFLLVGETLFILRDREPQVARPFRTPWFPRLPIWFYLSSLFMLYSSLSYAIEKRTYEALWAVGILVAGLVLSYFDPTMKRRPEEPSR
jgi:amino acid transporter